MKTTSIKLTLAALAALVSAPVFAADEVKLERAFFMPLPGCGHISCIRLGQYAEIKTKTIGANESVRLHYTLDGKTWKSFAAKKSIKGIGSSQWTLPDGFDYGGTTAPNKRFAVKYTVDGKTYWDNNGGKNYEFGRNTFNAIVKQDGISTGYDGCAAKKLELFGSILIRHLGNPKTVGIKYTLDNWSTSRIYAARYSGPSPGASTNGADTEHWTIDTPAFSSPKNLMQYVVYYTVNGKTYWDNNYGLNYKASCSDYDINWKYRY